MGWQFSIARLPRIEFGAGCLYKLPDIVASYGKRLVIVTDHTKVYRRLGEKLDKPLLGRIDVLVLIDN